jgi:prevent-host-death family protein
METVNLSEAKAHLGRYAEAVRRGRSFLIAVRNRPVAQLLPMPAAELGVRPKVGLRKGMASIPADFDAPLEAFVADYYGS